MADFEKMFLLASKKSVRMCICCRKRFLQTILLRLSIGSNGLGLFLGSGRSFYLCFECLENPKNENKIAKIKKLDTQAKHQLKEIIALWESRSKNLPQS